MNTDPNLRWDGQRWWRWNGQQWAAAQSEPESAKTYGRADVDSAAARMGWKLGAKRELRKLAEHLSVGETLTHVASGNYGGGVGVLALTDRRLVFLRDGWVRKTVEDFPLTAVTSVRWASGPRHGTVVICAAGGKSQVANVPKAQGKALTDACRGLLGAAPVQATAPPATPGAVLNHLTQMKAAGLISEAEFDTKRAEVLARM